MPNPNETDTTKAAETAAGGEADKSKVVPPATVAEPTEREAQQEKQIKQLNEENKKRRLADKEKDEKLERLDKALKLLTGESGEPDPVKLAQDKADGRIRRAYLKSAFVSEAVNVGTHDADHTFDALERSLTGIDVDLETGAVDKAAIRAKLDEFKKEKPFLFKSASDPVVKTPPRSPPDGGGAPAGGDPHKHWQQLKGTPGREKEASAFYVANRASILAHMK